MHRLSAFVVNNNNSIAAYLEERPQLHYNLRNRPGINKTLIEKPVDLNKRFLCGPPP